MRQEEKQDRFHLVTNLDEMTVSLDLDMQGRCRFLFIS